MTAPSFEINTGGVKLFLLRHHPIHSHDTTAAVQTSNDVRIQVSQVLNPFLSTSVTTMEAVLALLGVS